MVNAVELDLFIDESGRFMESDPAAQDSQRFPSQLAGILAPRGELTAETAAAVLRSAHEAASLPFTGQVHGNTVSSGDSFDRLLTAILDSLQARGWQPVRLVNDEAVNWGDRVTTYTAMVAELVIRVLELQVAGAVRPTSLQLIGAIVKLGEDDHGRPDLMESVEYERRLREQWAFAGIRRGAPRMSNQISLAVRLGSGASWPELQLCDLLSNASHARFKKCGEKLRLRFEHAFGDFDQTLVLRTVTYRVDEYLREGSFGLAVRSMLEARAELEASGPVAAKLRERLTGSIANLSALDAPWRNVQLQALTSWCEQVVEQSRQLELGADMIRWLLAKVDAPLRARLESAAGTIDWFSFALQRLALTAANHRGRLEDARAASDSLDRLVPRLAGHWEHATLLMQGFVAQAVHYTDSWQADHAAKRMELVAEYYRDLSALLSAAMPEVFPVRVHSELRGQALGTWLQAETYMALRNASRVASARALSDEAIDEFEAPSDKLRQYQYRSHLEVVAGDFAAARGFLARALEISDATHSAIAQHIGGLPAARIGFPLLHWFRLGAACCAAGESSERNSFLEALDSSRLADTAWVSSDFQDYPAHGIRRHLAMIFAARGKTSDALRVLERLRALVPLDASQNLFVLVLAAAQFEVAALCLDAEPAHAKRLLDDGNPRRPGVQQLVQRIERMPQIGAAVAGWAAAISRAVSTRSPGELLSLGRTIPY